MKILSPAFSDGADIPKRHTCDGPDASPPLQFSDVPGEADALALIADDPDAPMGTWVHWVLFNLPPDTKELPEGMPKSQFVLKNAAQGINDFGRIGYGGPCPPPGGPHRYFFKLYALRQAVNLQPGATKAQLLKALEGNILAEAHLMGRYKRGK
jgi:Raf kinase inhibitor-like YbhB/YbcL family protein